MIALDIGVDLDGVVYDFTDSLRQWVTATTAAAADQLPAPTCWEFFEVDWGMTLAAYLDHCNRAADAGHLFAGGVPLPGAVDALNRLDRAGHRLHIVTDRRFGRPGASRRNTLAWLARHDIPWSTLAFSADKTIVRTDLFIDDRPSNVDALRAAGSEAWLLDCGRSDQTGHPYLIARWADFEAKVAARAEETL